MTHTYAVLDVPRTVYAAIRALLLRADYSHAFHDDTDGEVIDLHGLALKANNPGSASTDITVSTLLSSVTKEGRVELQVNTEVVQMDLAKAREVSRMLLEAIEAAMTDQMLYGFLTESLGVANEVAAGIILDFRERRQGSRDRVQAH